MTSATSDSIAPTTSLTDGRSSAISASRRLRDSASAGNSSSASKAAVSRLPWPSLCGRPTTLAGVTGRGRGRGAARNGDRAGGVIVWGSSVRSGGSEPGKGRPSAGIGSGGHTVEAVVDPAQRFVPPEQPQGLEDPGRDRPPGERDPDRLEHLARLEPSGVDDALERAFETLFIPRLPHVRERVPGLGEALERLGGAEDLLPRGGIIGRPLEEEARQRPEVRQRRDLLLGDLDRPPQALAARERLEPSREVVELELAHVAPVDVAQLLLVEDGGRLGDPLERELALELLRGEELLGLLGAPAQQR